MHPLRFCALPIAFVLVVVACGGAASSPSPSATATPQAPTAQTVVLTEWKVAVPATLKADQYAFAIQNGGTILHELLVFKSDLAPSAYPTDDSGTGAINEEGTGINLLSDGECQEGSTWEAAMCAAHYRLDHLFAFIDCNNQQADGSPKQVMDIEPIDKKWQAFGWDTQRVNGNDIGAIVDAIERAKQTTGKPHAIVLDTLMGKDVKLFEEREKNHFIRVEPSEWAKARTQLEES